MRLGAFTWLTIVPTAVSLISLVSTQPSSATTKTHNAKHHAACCSKACSKSKKCGKHSHDIVHTAMAQPDLKQMSKALQDAGLVCILESGGPFTVFAPSDAAFAGQAKANQVTGDKDKLAKQLKYHVVKGNFSAADLANKRSIPTIEGECLMLNSKDGKLIVDGAIVSRDIPTSNGVIHVIDCVLSPERGK